MIGNAHGDDEEEDDDDDAQSQQTTKTAKDPLDAITEENQSQKASLMMAACAKKITAAEQVDGESKGKALYSKEMRAKLLSHIQALQDTSGKLKPFAIKKKTGLKDVKSTIKKAYEVMKAMSKHLSIVKKL